MTPVVVHWSAPVECPGQTVVEEQVLRLVDPAVTLEADVVVTAIEGGFRAVVRVRNGAWIGERALEAESCAELTRSTAVVLALSATLLSKAPPSAPLPPVPPLVPPPVSPAAPPPSPPVVLPSAAPPAASASIRRPELRIVPVGSLDVGTLPSPTFGGGIGVFVVPGGRVAVGLAGSLWANGRAYRAGTQEGTDLQMVAGDVTGCYALLRGRLELSPCAVVELAHVAASGFNETLTSSTSATWVSVGAGARARLGLGRWFALALDVSGLVPTQGQSFAVAEEPTLSKTTFYSIGPAALRVDLGPELHF